MNKFKPGDKVKVTNPMTLKLYPKEITKDKIYSVHSVSNTDVRITTDSGMRNGWMFCNFELVDSKTANSVIKCDCGALKAQTTHSNWCSTRKETT